MGSDTCDRHPRSLKAAVSNQTRSAFPGVFAMTVRFRACVVALLLAAAPGCSTHSTLADPKAEPAARRALNATVTIGGDCNYFVDAESGGNTTVIKAGQSVTWAWASGSHSITSGACCTADGAWDSGVMSPGSFTRTFPFPGSYPYFCSVHGSMMTGTVIVQPAGD